MLNRINGFKHVKNKTKLTVVFFVLVLAMFCLTGCAKNKANDDVIDIKVNGMRNFSGKTKAEIYKIRKHYVSKSIFKSKDYEPNEEVFGQIEDRLPWRSIFTEACSAGLKPVETKGWSEESRFIDNPAMLIGLYNKPIRKNHQARCDGTLAWVIPYRITYSPKEKLITAYYSNLQFLAATYDIETINAQDFGYKYGKMYSKHKIYFLDKNDNISKNIYEFRDFIHRGQSCGVPGGCNNMSPYIKGYVFTPILGISGTYSFLKHSIDFKLWKQKPKDSDVTPDMTYRIVFDFTSQNEDDVEAFTMNDTILGLILKLTHRIPIKPTDYNVTY